MPIIVQPIPLSGAGSARSADGGGVPLDAAGTWRVQVSANTPQGTVTGINANVDIRDEEGNLPEPAAAGRRRPAGEHVDVDDVVAAGDDRGRLARSTTP